MRQDSGTGNSPGVDSMRLAVEYLTEFDLTGKTINQSKAGRPMVKRKATSEDEWRRRGHRVAMGGW